MSEEHAEEIKAPKKGSPLSIVIPLVLVIAIVAAIGFYASKGGVEEHVAEAQLAEFANNIAKLSENEDGTSYLFTYGEVTVEGDISERVLTIATPSVEYNIPGEGGLVGRMHRFSTEKIEVHYAIDDLTKLSVHLPDPIRYESNKQVMEHPLDMFIAADEPLVLHYTSEAQGEDELSLHSLSLQLPAEGLNIIRDEIRTATLRYMHANPIVLEAEGEAFALFEASKENSLSFGFEEVTLRSIQFPLAVTASAFAVEAEKINRQQDRYALDYSVRVEGLQVEDVESPLLPISLELDVDYVGALASSIEELQDALIGSPVYLDIEHMGVEMGATQFELHGLLENAGREFLPYVNATLDIREFVPFYDALVKQGNILPTSEDAQLVELFTQKIIGAPLSEVQDATIFISRDEESAFQIGETTFEELVALWVAQQFSKKSELPDGLDEVEIRNAFEETQMDKPTPPTQE